MKKRFFRFLNQLNKAVLPSYTQKGLNLSKANKFQLAVIGWKSWVLKRALD